MRLGKNKPATALLVVLAGTLVAQLAIAQGSTRSQVADGAVDGNTDGDALLDCAPGELMQGAVGFINLGDPAPTEIGAIENLLDDRISAAISLEASAFEQISVVEKTGSVVWLSKDRQMVVLLEQNDKGQWQAVARHICSDIAESK
jgi:hypothetical protein